MNTINIGIPMDVQKLIDTRALIQASSGGGKSYLLRKIVESVGSQVQQIILDPEGEFVTLREKFDFALVGKEGDIPLNLKYAETLAHKLLETNLSCIIDLYELKHHERILFVKRFLDALINAPKDLWHSCLVYVDEAHIFCPESSKAESMGSVIDLCTRGRKRGFAAVLATQRISKLHKDAAAECLNKMIGRTGLDIDRNRAGDELGMTKKADNLVLRELQPGEFFAYGPAISNEVKKFKVLPVVTTHLSAGKRIAAGPPTPNAIKNILGKLSNMPEEAEKELNTSQQLRAEVTRLRIELTRALKSQPAGQPNPGEILKLNTFISDLRDQVEKYIVSEANQCSYINDLWKAFGGFVGVMNDIQKKNSKIGAFISKTAPKVPEINIVRSKFNTPVQKIPPASEQPKGMLSQVIEDNRKAGKISVSSVTGGAMRMLKAAAMYSPGAITKTRMAAIARLSHSSGSFGTYISTLKGNGYLVQEGKEYIATDHGVQAAGSIDALPTNPDQLVEMWCDIIGSGSGAARILRKLKEAYPEYVTKADLGIMVDMSSTSGSFGTYISKLKGNGLIVSQGSSFRASPELFELWQKI